MDLAGRVIGKKGGQPFGFFTQAFRLSWLRIRFDLLLPMTFWPNRSWSWDHVTRGRESIEERLMRKTHRMLKTQPALQEEHRAALLHWPAIWSTTNCITKLCNYGHSASPPAQLDNNMDDVAIPPQRLETPSAIPQAEDVEVVAVPERQAGAPVVQPPPGLDTSLRTAPTRSVNAMGGIPERDTP